MMSYIQSLQRLKSAQGVKLAMFKALTIVMLVIASAPAYLMLMNENAHQELFVLASSAP